MKTDPAVEAYFAEAQSWDADRRALLDRSNRRAWRVAGAAVVVATLSVGALAVLTPLKTVVPYVIRVDQKTGVVDIVPPATGNTTANEAVTRYLLTHYVTTRERYVGPLAETDYEFVGAFNTPILNQSWYATWDPHNTESPLNRYKDGTTVRVQIQSITFLNPSSGEVNVAQVRFVTGTKPGGTGLEQIHRWLATITYRYVSPPKDDKVRALNPLGFRVTDYRKEPEVVETAVAGGAP